MRKILVIFLAVVCVMLAGCGNKFAKDEYYLTSAIAADDHYSETGYKLTTTNDGINVEAKRFNGRETVWTITEETDLNVAVQVSFSVSEGKAKLVQIDSNGNVSTVAELAAYESPMLKGKTITLNKGENKFKLVGYGCKKLELQMMILEYDTEIVGNE